MSELDGVRLQSFANAQRGDGGRWIAPYCRLSAALPALAAISTNAEPYRIRVAQAGTRIVGVGSVRPTATRDLGGFSVR